MGNGGQLGIDKAAAAELGVQNRRPITLDTPQMPRRFGNGIKFKTKGR
jgi:hypothetical protein